MYVRVVRNIGRQEGRPALSSVGVREAAMRRLASVRETSIGHNITGSFEPGVSSGCFVTHQIRRK